jgi:hypothetical protein
VRVKRHEKQIRKVGKWKWGRQDGGRGGGGINIDGQKHVKGLKTMNNGHQGVQNYPNNSTCNHPPSSALRYPSPRISAILQALLSTTFKYNGTRCKALLKHHLHKNIHVTAHVRAWSFKVTFSIAMSPYERDVSLLQWVQNRGSRIHMVHAQFHWRSKKEK